MTHKFRKLTAMFLAVVMVLSVAALSACKKDHEHTYATEWTKDATSHWHAATCGHDDAVADKAEHDFDSNGKCTVCGYEKSTAPQPDVPHTHTYTQSWWNDETNHWHAATCEHTQEKSDLATHTLNDYGRCTVCGYMDESKIKYNTQLTAEQWTAACEAFAKSDNFTAILKYTEDAEFNELFNVDGDLLHNISVEYNGELNEVYEKYGENGNSMIVLYMKQFSMTDDPFYREDAMGILQSMAGMLTDIESFDDLVWNEETQAYDYEAAGLSFRFVGDRIYTVISDVDGETQTITDIDNTVVEYILDHQHDQAQYYTTSSMYHWHKVLCQDHTDKIVEKQPHTFGTDGKCSVCGYARTGTVSRQVTEEQWQEAFGLEGILNYDLEMYRSVYPDQKTKLQLTAHALHVNDNTFTSDTLVYDDAYHMYAYGQNYEGKQIKYSIGSLEGSTIISACMVYANMLSVIGDVYEWAEYDSASGVYKINNKPLDIIFGDSNDSYNVEVTFNGTELEKLSLVMLDTDRGVDTLAFTFGNTVVDLPQAEAHTHNYVPSGMLEDTHDLTCSTCGAMQHDIVHTPGADGKCSVCGVDCNETHTHEYTVPTRITRSPSSDRWTLYHVYACECGCQDDAYSGERHTFENGVCTLCGEEQHTHDNVINEEFTDGLSHDVTCKVCHYRDVGSHSYGSDDKCEVCGQARCWHESDNWVKNGSTHSGLCKKCNTYIDHEWHVYDEQDTCKMCGAKDHDHTWGAATALDAHSSYYYAEHSLTCTDCGVTITAEHQYPEGDTCACGVAKHEHTRDRYFPPIPDRQGLTHSYKCGICGKLISEEHDFGTGNVCKVCGYEK